MFTCFLVCFTVVAVIIASAISAASIPRPSRKGNGIPIPLIKHSPLLNSNTIGTTHPSALKRSRSAGLDLATASPDYDVWYGTISIGTPPKVFTVQVDTGSRQVFPVENHPLPCSIRLSDLFIPASTGDEFCKSHDNLWNPASSTTAKNLDKPFETEFGDGATVKGQLYTDNITIAGFTVDMQTFGVATAYSADMEKSKFPADGMLGLAFSSISNYPASSLLETLVSEGKLPNAVFSLELTPDGGELYIGGANEDLYSGDITYVNVPVRVPGFWRVTVEDIRVNDKPVLTRVPAIIDCGANYIFGDQDRVLKLHQAYGGKAFENGWYTFPCDHFPDVAFTFGGKQFTIPADELDFGPVEEGSPDCFSGIMTRSKNDVSYWTIGSVFLQNFYTVYNMDSQSPRVGFAQLKGWSEA